MSTIEKTADDKKEYRNKYMKEYRKLNNDKIMINIKCDICDCYYKKVNKSHHMRSKRHELNELRKKVNELESKK